VNVWNLHALFFKLLAKWETLQEVQVIHRNKVVGCLSSSKIAIEERKEIMGCLKVQYFCFSILPN